MRKGMKRLIAALLLVCTLASFVVPATFADGGSQETVAQSFNFALYNDPAHADIFTGSSGSLKATGFGDNCEHCGGTVQECIASRYASLNWKLEVNGFSSSTFQSSTDGGLRLRNGSDLWVAFRVNVLSAGTYTLVANKTYSYTYAADVFVLPAPAQTMDAAAVNAAAVAGNKVGQINFTGAQTQAEIGQWTAPAAGEYVIILKNTAESNSRIYINTIDLIGDPQGGSTTAPTDASTDASTEASAGATQSTTVPGELDTTTPGAVVKYYDFTIDDAMLGTRSTLGLEKDCQCGCGKKLSEHLAELNVGWTHLENTLESILFVKGGDHPMRMRNETNLNATAAFTLEVPAAGEFSLRYSKAYGSAGVSDVYLFTAAEFAAGAQADEAHLVGRLNAASGATTVAIGTYEFSAAGDYVILFQMVNSKDMYIGALELVVPTGDEPEQTIPSTEPRPTECTGTYEEGVYNMALYNEDARQWMFHDGSKLATKDISKNCGTCGKKISDCLAAQYAAGKLNWTIESTSFATLNFLPDGDAGLRMRYALDENGATIKDENGDMVELPDNFVAFRMKVNNAGTKRITVFKNYKYAFTADMYIFPAPAQTMTRAQVEEKLTAENLAGNMTFTGDMQQWRVGEYNFEAAGEYIVVLKDTGTYKRIYLSAITLTEPTPDPDIPVTDKKVYDFDLSREDPLLDRMGANSRYNNDRNYRVRAYMQDRYKAGTTDWKFETASTELGLSDGNFREGCFRFKNNDGYQKNPGSWYSFRIKNPGTATYDIRLVSNGKSKLVADVYLIPAENELVLTEEQIEAAMTSDNLLVKNALFENEGTFYLGEYTFGKNEEYVLVFDFIKGSLLHIQEIRMTVDGLVADTAISKEKSINGVVYDFDLTDSMNGIFTEKTVYLQDKFDTLEKMYANGSINWKWYAACTELMGTTLATKDIVGTTTRFYRNTGMRIYGKQDYWTAFKLRSPGSGTFTLSLDHAVYAYSGTLAFYVLPGDTAPEDVYKAMDPSNRVGKVLLTAESTTLTDGSTTYIGHWDFEAGKEYIVVFECYDVSPYNSSYCYVNYSHLNMERGKIDFTPQDQKIVEPITVAEKPLKVADFRGYAAIKNIGGHDYYIMPCEGGDTLVYDLDTKELVDSFGGGFELPADVYEDSEGMIWMTGQGKKLLKYDPYTQVSTTYSWTGQGFGYVTGGYNLLEYENKIYFTSDHDGYLMYFDKETELFGEACHLIGGNGDDTHALTYLNGYMYMAVSSADGIHVVKYDPVTNQEVIVKNIKDVQGKATAIGTLNIMGDGELLLAGTFGGVNFSKCIAFDPETLELVETNLPDCAMARVSEVYNGKQYIAVANGNGLWEYDVETKEFSKTPGMPSGGIGFVSRKNVIDIEGKTYLFTASTGAGGNPRMYDLEGGQIVAWDDLVKHGEGGTRLLSIAVGEEGDNGLYVGGFNTKNSFVFDTEKGEITATYITGGQGDSAVWYNGKLYYGNYSSTTLNEIYPYTGDMNKDPRDNDVIQRWKLDHTETGQKRVLELATGDGYVFAGTVPDSNQWGGAITVYNTANGQWYTHRNIVQDHSITGLTHSGKLVWASSAFTPGTGTSFQIEQKENAQIVAYDYEKREVVARFDPAKYIPGLATPVSYIAGIEADPVVENRIWAAVSETMFCFDYDPDTKEFKMQEIYTIAKDSYYKSAGRIRYSHDFLFDVERGYVYYAFNSGTLLTRFQIEDFNAPMGKLKVKSVKQMMGDITTHYVIANDGDFYYIAQGGTDLKMLPLNVTDEDWAIAKAVDQMILDLGEITLEKEAAIKEVRSAYENLKWRYKALVQELDTLLEAEVDLLECKINEALTQEITADSVEPLQVFVDEHKAMLPRYQNYVKNYDALMEAFNAATALNDERVAKALQARIDALADKFPMTLEIEPEVVAIRTDYDACTPSQRLLVDITLLEKAEAEIAVLRADFVKYVESLIQAIPAEITLEAEPAITAAREAADKLYTTERKEVSYSKLTSAEGKLRTLKNAKAAAEEVDALIDAIGLVTLGDKARIAEAREAYDALKDVALQFVTKAGKLKTAEFILKALQTWGIPAITIVNAALVVVLVPSLRKKIFKGKKKEESETVDN